jgi:hypothetical protein
MEHILRFAKPRYVLFYAMPHKTVIMSRVDGGRPVQSEARLFVKYWKMHGLRWFNEAQDGVGSVLKSW